MSAAAAQKKTGARQQRQKVLRVGVIQNGRPIEERLFRKRQTVTVGQTPKQTFCIPVANIPKSLTVFSVKGTDYYLHFDEKMQGRISLGDGVHDLAGLRSSGKAQRSGNQYSVKLNEKARGKVVVGEITLLFQFVIPPPPRQKPQLPATMRAGWIRSMDWNLVVIIAISGIIQGGSVLWIQSQDWPEPRDVNALPDRFVSVLIDKQDDLEKTDEDLELEKDPDAEGEGPAEEEAKPEPTKTKQKVDPDKRAKDVAARKKALAKKVENKTILKKLGTLGGDGAPSLLDSLQGGADKRSLDEAFSGSTGVAEARNGAERSGLNRAGSADATGAGRQTGIGDLGGVKGAGDAKVDTGAKRDAVKVQARVNIRGPEKVIGDGVVDKNAVAAVIKRRKGAIQSCYERELKKNPNIAGKIVVRFNIGTAGRVTSASVSSDSLGAPAVGSCVVSRIKSWRFPKPEGGSVTVTKTFVFASSK